MTAIIGLRREDEIILAADGVSLLENWKEEIQSHENYKIVPVNGSPSCLLAATGTCAVLNIVKNIPDLLEGKEDVDFDYVAHYVVNRIFETLRKRNLVVKDDDAYRIDSSFALITPTRMFTIEGYGIVHEMSRCCFLGCGSAQLSASYSLFKDSGFNDHDLAVECLKLTIKTNPYIDYPLYITSSKSDEVHIIYEDGSERREKFR